MKKLYTILGIILLFFSLVAFLLLSFYEPVSLEDDSTFLVNTKTISKTEFNLLSTDSPIFIGWSRTNFTPSGVVHKTRGLFQQPYEDVLDSLFINCIYLKKDTVQFVILSYDLLLVTPELASSVKMELLSRGISNVYFSASHTHSSFGGFGKGLVAEIALGEFDQSIFDGIIDRTIVTLDKAIQIQDTLQNISYKEKKVNRAINRLISEYYVEERLRQVHFSSTRHLAVMNSLNIHPTFVSSKRKVISKDYPKIFSKEKTAEFGMFVAGAMGSIKPMNFKRDTSQITRFKAIIDTTQYSVDDSTLRTDLIGFSSIKLVTPCLRPLLTQNICSSQLLSSVLIGIPKISIEVLRIGEVLMIALPCELSSEFYPELQKLAEAKGLRLIITSFNGSYVGYATPSRNFYIDHMETRMMNWTGKYGGDYFNELVRLIIEKQP